MPKEYPAPKRRLGDYYRSGNWSDYWKTSISQVLPGVVRVRGYDTEDIIENLGYAEYFYMTIKGELPTKAQARVFEAVMCAFPDHQFIASDPIAARAVASAHSESPVPGIVAGLLCIGMHTISPQDAAEVVADSFEMMKVKKLTPRQAAKAVVKDFTSKKRYIPGFGHPTHKDGDPRALALQRVAKKHGVWGEKAQLYELIHEEFVKKTGRNLPINIDGMVACVLTELEFNPMQMAGVAAAGRLPGIVAHVIEEIMDGVPLRVVPEELGARYVGPAQRKIPKNRK